MLRRLLCVMLITVGLVACGGDDGGETVTTPPPVEELDLEALGLWDDGPCDSSAPPLVVGLTTAFETAQVAALDQARGLEAAAEAFNARGGANGSCVEVHTCDDGANADQALACVRELDEAGVVATINDLSTAGQADVSTAFSDAGIARIGTNVTNVDWGDPNSYPLDASGTGYTFLAPQGLVEAGLTDVGIIRVDLAQASALIGLLGDLYPDLEFVADLPVANGTTDYNQFILGAQDAGAEGVILAISQAAGTQIIRAAQQLASPMQISASLGSFTHADVAAFGDIAEQIVFVAPFGPATADIPVFDVLRADLAASGEEFLQPQNLRGTAMRSWIGLYATLRMIRDDGLTDFTRESMTDLLRRAEDVPMLGIYGDEDWTPNANHPGLYERAGINRWATWTWDPDATWAGGEGNWVLGAEFSFDEVLCGSPFGAPEPC